MTEQVNHNPPDEIEALRREIAWLERNFEIMRELITWDTLPPDLQRVMRVGLDPAGVSTFYSRTLGVLFCMKLIEKVETAHTSLPMQIVMRTTQAGRDFMPSHIGAMDADEANREIRGEVAGSFYKKGE